MLLVFLLQATQDRDRVLDSRFVHHHWLEPTGKGCIFFHMLPVFIERRGTHAVQLAASKRRLQQVGGIHRPIRLPCTHQRMHFVNEQDDLAVVGLHLVQHSLQPLFEFTAIFCTGNQRAHVERHQLLVLEALGHVTIDDTQRQSFGDCGLANAGLTDQNRIVLRPTRQNLDRAADFIITTDNGIKLAFPRFGRQVTGILLERVKTRFRVCTVSGTPLANLVDHLIERVGGHTTLLQ